MQKADQLRAEIASISDLLKNGRPERAIKRATKAAKKWPNVSALHRLAALCAVQQQNFKLAQTHFERAWRLEPANAELIQNYGLSMVQAGDSDAALRFMDKIGARAPLTPPQQFIRAMALLNERQERKALTAIEQVVKRQPANLQAHCLKADILDGLHQWDRAIEVLTALVKQHPKFHFGQLRLAKAHSGMGHMEDALKHGRAALKLVPGHPETLEFMASLPNLSQDDISSLKVEISKSLDAATPNREAAAMLRFAAASLAKRDKDTAQEMQHLSTAHGVLREGFAEWEKRSELDCAKRLAAPLPAAASEPRTDIPHPIFVVGLPRSGTTLVERVLAAHSKVQGLGELANVHLWARKAEDHPAVLQDAQKLADFYADTLPEIADTAVAFVDKAPGNYAFLGAMAQAFPNAVILNVERDPRDVALSMWRTHFGAGGLYYTHDLKWMAAEANRYRRYMQHWRDVLPDRIYNVQYEHLVRNLEDTARELAGICDLTFEDSMLSPQKSSDAVKTASSLQVRQPVHTSSVGRWQQVEDHLAPFIENLDAGLWADVMVETQ